jgi:sn-2 palmitoyl-lipid 9-desaturase
MPSVVLDPVTDSPNDAEIDVEETLQTQPSRAELLQAFYPDKLRWQNFDWIVIIWMAAMHIGCVFAPFFFTWEALGVTIILHWLTCSIGICLGYHRYLSHRSMKLARPAEFFVLLCGALSGEGSPLTWSATHRLHHQKSDKRGDPHSPLDGKWWSHLLWLFVLRTPQQQELLFETYVPDLGRRPMVRFFEKTTFLWLVAAGVGLFALGGLPMFLWGVCVRMTLAYHSTWFVNSATHLWGYRNYETKDRSRNLWWVAILAYGEGWHNNHHAHPRLAFSGHRWWEFDMTGWVIRGLRFCRLAHDVNDRYPKRMRQSEEQ